MENRGRTAVIIPSDHPDTWKGYRIWGAAIIIGVVAYLLSLGAHWSFSWFTSMHAAYRWWPFLSLPLCGIAITWFVRRVGPGTEGSGIQQAVAAMHVAESKTRVGWLINLRLAAAKFLSIIVGMGGGFVLGIEGPTVQIGASIMYAFRRFYPHDNPALRRQLIMAGGAAGISAAFNAPMAGLMFAFEELGRTISWHASARVMLSVVISGIVSYGLRGSVVFFDYIEFHRHITPALGFLLLGVTLAGTATGSFFAWLAVRTDEWMPGRLRALRKKRPYAFVVACAVLIALLGSVSPIFGSGVELTGEVLRGATGMPWHYAPCKLAGMILTLMTGVPGGVFSPSLALGAGVGSWFLRMGDPAWHSAIIAIGMVSCLSAVTRAPLTAAIIIAEMTGAHDIMLVAMGASLLASYLSRFTHVMFYHDLARRALRGIPEEVE